MKIKSHKQQFTCVFVCVCMRAYVCLWAALCFVRYWVALGDDRKESLDILIIQFLQIIGHFIFALIY